ncbi:porphobilinogen synthase, putative [Talaromyces stipitatus ATCC 10500]|uniref:Delta-aminolevulinic acid dehydratase n=1 Tax=Talaromyces stipitatus (strain ATCC 10500 / CBS 375.48 / QM 6759 / NRRL 1006) TaxID=441959 RepID=B8MVJ8_TALSN|nr:porphobilinogen synthase, putative [Talaromyces stipitatus ATCC 10500]EED11425.1 porphobilinogen synthase, putative [Talaromyces stipitatus ATCC 10500]
MMNQMGSDRHFTNARNDLADLISSPLRSGFAHPLSRSWHREREITKSMFILPVFVSDIDDEESPIPLLTDIPRLGLSKLIPYLQKLVNLGLRSVILFGVLGDKLNPPCKDATGTAADDPKGPVIRAIRSIGAHFPSLFIITDVCLCEYTNHGHCGIFSSAHGDDKVSTDNNASVTRIADIALAYAQAGAHCVAPSDMNDGRIHAVKSKLIAAGLGERVLLMAYSAKFKSCLYGPFRTAAGSTPSYGDRATYQLPCHGGGLARRALVRDINEGADVIMVKPAGSCLDVVFQAKEIGKGIPVAAYQVSGEYAMIRAGAEAGVFDLKTAAFESVEMILRAGANIIISYFTPAFLGWLEA